MADDEQFSLCWNNFNSNLSAGFHESLCRGDLVDVTLAAEGQLVKAHRLVLSVCSPYFRKMFTQMPPNQHAFVFLKDVSHTALKDLIQFMYCGEVNVKQEALPAFISTAEALQIKGLTDSDPPTSQSPAKPSTPAPQPSPIQQMPSPRVRHRASTSRSYNIESMDESVDDKQTTQIVIQTTTPQKAQTTTIVQQPQHQQTQQQQQQHHHQTQQHYQPQQTTTTIATTTNVSHKRPAQRNSGVTSQTKRTKSTIDPLEATENPPSSQQITLQTVVTDSKPAQQQANEAEFIDLPIELPTKSEPDYTEEAGEDVTAEQETTYVEDDSYGDMRYDESYFTENEDAANATANSVSGNISGAGASTSKAIAKQQAFSDSSYAEAADQTNNEAQGEAESTKRVDITPCTPGNMIPLHAGSHVFVSKSDLMQIFITNACIYTSRLSELVFGKDVLEKVATASVEDRLNLLDKELLKSIIKSLVTPIVKAVRRRGRPKLKPDDAVPQEKLADKIKAAVSKGPGQPTIYASTTKGGMKLIYNGHHFIYSFRKGQYSIFQCCYKENKEQCKVRVVSDQKRVFHLDGEHVHFIQATDKSVTSLHFETAESQEESTTMKEKETPLINESNEIISSDKEIDQPMAVNDSTNYIEGKLFDEDLDTSYDADSQQELDANNFREKIKKRLQKALLGKKK